MPSKKSVREAATQLLSLVLGSDEEVAVAALGLEVLAAVVSVTVVVVTVLVAAAGFSAEFVDGSAAGSPVAGSVPGADGLSPGTSTPLASPTGATKRADASDPPRQATLPSAPDASSQDASPVSCPPAPSPRPATCSYTP